MVAGLAVFERETYYLAQSLDLIQAQYFPDFTEPITFHAAPLYAPDGLVAEPFNRLTRDDRHKLAGDVYRVIAESRCRVFIAALEKQALRGDQPYERGFEEIVNRFDKMLSREGRNRGEPQRGLIVLSQSSYRENLETLARKIWSQGHRWGEMHNMADVPFFAPAKSTRLLQLADFVSNAAFGRFETGYARNFDAIAGRIDREDHRLHGLVHITEDRRSCFCPACVTHRAQPRASIDED